MSLPVERGRDIRPPPTTAITHTGRGGAGNVRSPSSSAPSSRDRAAAEDAYEAQLVRERRAAEQGNVRSTGIGGFGNMANKDKSRSRSRSRGDGPRLVAGGRGGAGNMYSVAGADPDEVERLRALDEEDEVVRKNYEGRHEHAIHSTGKGPSRLPLCPSSCPPLKTGSLTLTVPTPSTVPGGAGNMVQGSVPSFESHNSHERSDLLVSNYHADSGSHLQASGYTSGSSLFLLNLSSTPPTC